MKIIQLSALLCLSVAFFTSCNPKEPKPTLSRSQLDDRSQEVRIALNEATTCDPRLARNLGAINVVRFLFDGLVRQNANGKLEPALAESYEISPDGITYTFTLRNCNWSNGDKITAQDIEYSLKSSLDPAFQAPNAYQLFVIQNAKASYDGKLTPDTIGVKALNERIVEIKLENPTPYFLELLTFHPFFPVSEKWVKTHPDWKEGTEMACVSSGPFVLESWNPHSEIALKKNSAHFDAQRVKLEKIQLTCLDENTALNMFEVGDLEWAGSPISSVPPDAISTLKKEKKLQIAPAAGTQIIRVNCESLNFSNPKMRHAFAYAIDRAGICEHILQGGHFPATSFVPPCMGLPKNSFFDEQSPDKAKALFQEALMESKQENSSPITLSYVTNERNQKIAQALQQNWKNVFQIDVLLEPCESKTFFDKISKRDFQLALGSWFADYNDPISFLSVFQYKNNGTNNTQWESQEYQKLLAESALAQDSQKRFQILDSAQEVLMSEMPAIPIFHYTFNYLIKDSLKDANLSPLGYIELNEAYMTK
jgi:oligopeptide transport system substrate-binding protein